MWTGKRVARSFATVWFSGLCFVAFAADSKPDKKKSQAAYQRATRAAEAGRRDEAIAGYTERLRRGPVECRRAMRPRQALLCGAASAKRRRPTSMRPCSCSPPTRSACRARRFLQRDRTAAARHPGLSRSRSSSNSSAPRSTTLWAPPIWPRETRRVRSRSSPKPSACESTIRRHTKAAAWRGRRSASIATRSRTSTVHYAIGPISRKRMVERALAHSALGDYPAALADLDAALRLRPDDLRAMRIRGAVRERAGDDRARHRRLHRGDRARPQGCAPVPGARRRLRAAAKNDEALRDREQAVQLESQDPGSVHRARRLVPCASGSTKRASPIGRWRSVSPRARRWDGRRGAMRTS